MSREEFEALVAATNSRPEKRRTESNPTRGKFTKTRKEQGRLEVRSASQGASAETERKRLIAVDDFEDVLCSKNSPLMRIHFQDHGFDQVKLNRFAFLMFHAKVKRIHKRTGIDQTLAQSERDCGEIWSTFDRDDRLPFEKLALYRHFGSPMSLSSTFKLGEDEAYTKFMDLKEAAEATPLPEFQPIQDEEYEQIGIIRNPHMARMHQGSFAANNYEMDIDLDNFEDDINEVSTLSENNDNDGEVDMRARDYEAMGDIGEEVDEFEG